MCLLDHDLISYRYSSSCWVFKSDRDEIWQDCSTSE